MLRTDPVAEAKWNRYQKERAQRLDGLLRKIHKDGDMSRLHRRDRQFLYRVSAELRREQEVVDERETAARARVVQREAG